MCPSSIKKSMLYQTCRQESFEGFCSCILLVESQTIKKKVLWFRNREFYFFMFLSTYTLDNVPQPRKSNPRVLFQSINHLDGFYSRVGNILPSENVQNSQKLRMYGNSVRITKYRLHKIIGNIYYFDLLQGVMRRIAETIQIPSIEQSYDLTTVQHNFDPQLKFTPIKM